MKLYNLLLEIESELSEDYPEIFKFEDLKNEKTFKGKIDYLKNILGKHLGKGTSRIVFNVDNDKVLKVALNQKGLAQNESEIDLKDEKYLEDIIAKVYDYDKDDYIWVEMEKATKAKKSDFKKFFNIEYSILYDYIYSQIFNRNFGYYIENYDYANKILEIIISYDYNFFDVLKINSWGIVKRDGQEKLVLIDFGLTNDNYIQYYKRKK